MILRQASKLPTPIAFKSQASPAGAEAGAPSVRGGVAETVLAGLSGIDAAQKSFQEALSLALINLLQHLLQGHLSGDWEIKCFAGVKAGVNEELV